MSGHDRHWRAFAMCSLCLLLTALNGCAATGQIFWSPDGTRAAYNSGGESPQGMVIDADGKILHDLGASSGFAWSADSKTLYYANAVKPTPDKEVGKQLTAQFKRNDNWADAPIDAAGGDDEHTTIVHAYGGNTDTPLFNLPKSTPGTLLLSPDGKWLACVAWHSTKNDADLELYVFSLATHTLYPLANGCGLGTCFTGPDQLAFVANIHPGGPAGANDIGALTEMTLSDLESQNSASPRATRTTLAYQMMDDANWMQSLDGDILFSAVAWQYPHLAGDHGDNPIPQLYRYSRSDGKLIKLADNVGPLFALSPDGKRILFEQMNAPPAGGHSQNEDDGSLAVMNTDGSNVRLLRGLRQYKDLPLMPNWRGNDEITFVPSIADSKQLNGHINFDLILYRITEKGMEPLRTLSETWKENQKPAGEPSHP